MCRGIPSPTLSAARQISHDQPATCSSNSVRLGTSRRFRKLLVLRKTMGAAPQRRCYWSRAAVARRSHSTHLVQLLRHKQECIIIVPSSLLPGMTRPAQHRLQDQAAISLSCCRPSGFLRKASDEVSASPSSLIVSRQLFFF